MTYYLDDLLRAYLGEQFFDAERIEESHPRTVAMERIAERVGVKVETVRQWRIRGMDERNADRAAVALGLTAEAVWPDFGEDWLTEEAMSITLARLPRCAECDAPFEKTHWRKRFCSTRCQKRAGMRRLRAENPAYAQRQREASRRWYQECHDYALARQRKWREANPEYHVAQVARWRKENPEKFRAQRAAYRARKRSEAA